MISRSLSLQFRSPPIDPETKQAAVGLVSYSKGIDSLPSNYRTTYTKEQKTKKSAATVKPPKQLQVYYSSDYVHKLEDELEALRSALSTETNRKKTVSPKRVKQQQQQLKPSTNQRTDSEAETRATDAEIQTEVSLSRKAASTVHTTQQTRQPTNSEVELLPEDISKLGEHLHTNFGIDLDSDETAHENMIDALRVMKDEHAKRLDFIAQLYHQRKSIKSGTGEIPVSTGPRFVWNDDGSNSYSEKVLNNQPMGFSQEKSPLSTRTVHHEATNTSNYSIDSLRKLRSTTLLPERPVAIDRGYYSDGEVNNTVDPSAMESTYADPESDEESDRSSVSSLDSDDHERYSILSQHELSRLSSNRSRSRSHSRASSLGGSKKQITIPKPFAFDTRESTKPKSISQRRFEQDLAERAMKEEAILNKQFRANSVPPSTLLPLYSQIMEEQERRREEVKRESKKLTMSMLRPFSFDKRDVEKARRSPPKSSGDRELEIKYKANPVPAYIHNSEPLALLNAKDEAERKQRVQKRAMELLEQSRLPPRMERYNQTLQQAQFAKQAGHPTQSVDQPTDLPPEFTFQPNINHSVPDFKKLQSEFAMELRRRKKSKAPIKTEEFRSASRPKRNDTARILREIHNDEYRLNEMRWPYRSKRRELPPSFASLNDTLQSNWSTLSSKSTKAAELRNETVRRSLELRELKSEISKEQDRLRKKRQRQIDQKFSAFFAKQSAEAEEARKEMIRTKQHSMRASTRNYEDQISRMSQELDTTRPYLFEYELMDKATQNALRSVRQILEETGNSSLVAEIENQHSRRK